MPASSIRLALTHHSREAIARELQATLVELVDLSLIRELDKQLWMVRRGSTVRVRQRASGSSC